MEQKQPDKFTLKDEIIVLFRPIELLFKIMDTSSVEIYGELTRSYAEVGITLCQNFRQNLDILLEQHTPGDKND